ncbi:MAG TPA: hypothetical protein VKF36_02905 [Syntrophorhabdales bacterium]|nr:hypothetical protein [Syntrophorhabdales bacterium]
MYLPGTHRVPAGPTIGPQTQNDPYTTVGSGFSPQMIERFTEVEGDKLIIYYTMSTWNPHTAVLMRSEFTIARRALGESWPR